MVSASFMPPGEANYAPAAASCPARPTLEHYVALFTRLDLARHFLNSALITVLATVLSVLVNSLAGYAFAKLPLPRSRPALQRTRAGALVVPAQVGMLPLFLLLRELGLVNTYVGVHDPVPGQHLRHLPDPPVRARACPTSCSTPRASTAPASSASSGIVVLPVIRPILVTLATFTFLSAWNDFMWPLIILSDSAHVHAAGGPGQPGRASTCRTPS